jgi:hypothetical protein
MATGVHDSGISATLTEFASGGLNPALDRSYNLVFKFDQNFGSRKHVFFRQASNDRSELRGTNGVRGPGS